MAYEGPGVYRHYKTMRYVAIGTATHTETQEQFVVYRRMSDPGAQLYVRPLKMFNEMVDLGSGVFAPRFVLLSRHERPKGK
jgi:hypothetical protein